jgi:hypothetical protein
VRAKHFYLSFNNLLIKDCHTINKPLVAIIFVKINGTLVCGSNDYVSFIFLSKDRVITVVTNNEDVVLYGRRGSEIYLVLGTVSLPAILMHFKSPSA